MLRRRIADMSKDYFSMYNKDAKPTRQQNLFISKSKHLYCLEDGSLKYQAKALDPRIGNKNLITRMVLLDTDTGTVYGECHLDDSAKDLIGFLARAWSIKKDHPMRGLPSLLNIPKIVITDEDYRSDITVLLNITDSIWIGDMPSGFEAGVHAVKQFEKNIESLMRMSNSNKNNRINILTVQACSALVSVQSSSSDSFFWNEKWREINPPDKAFLKSIDNIYESNGAWRKYPFDKILSQSN